MTGRGWKSCLAPFIAMAGFAANAAVVFSTSFEPEEGYGLGDLGGQKVPWIVDRKPAVVTKDESYGGTQSLSIPPAEPFGQVHVSSRVLTAADSLFLDCWMRLSATKDAIEFLEFDGALLAFVDRGETGEFHVFHATDRENGMWIATGHRFPITSEGRSKDWMRVTIQRNYKTGFWTLYVNGKLLFIGARAIPGDFSAERTCYMAGYENGVLSMDDFYIGDLDPFVFTQEVIEPAAAPSSPERAPFPQIVGKKIHVQRSQRVAKRADEDALPLIDPKLKAWSIEGRQGGEASIPKKTFDANDSNPDGLPSIMAFAPRYDEEGKPLPMTLILSADVELKPGVDLRRLRWEVRRLRKKFEGPPGEILFSGSFAGGPTQTVVVPGEDVRKGMETLLFVE